MPEFKITNNSPSQTSIVDPRTGVGLVNLKAGATATVEVTSGEFSRVKDQLKELRGRKLSGGGDAFTITILDSIDNSDDIGSGFDASEIWVSPDGDDNSSGTRDAPYKTIQAAVDDLDELYDQSTIKTIRLLPGVHEPATLHTQGWRIIGEAAIFGGVGGPSTPTIKGGSNGIPLMMTNLTRTSYASFESDGGISFDISGGTWTWDGAVLTGREINYGEDASSPVDSDIMISGVRVYSDGNSVDGKPISACMLLSPGTSGTDVFCGGARFDRVDFQGDTLFKNTYRLGFNACASSIANHYFDVAQGNIITSSRFDGDTHYRDVPTTLGDEGTNKVGAFYSQFTSAVFVRMHYYGGPGEQLVNTSIEEELNTYNNTSLTLLDVVVGGSLGGDGDIDFTGGGWTGNNNNTGLVTYTDLKTTP